MTSTEDVSLFGWDLTYNSVKNDIKTKEDLLAVLIHWCLIKSGFRCVGVGESMESCESDQPSEVLPEGWNYTDNYALRYLFKGKLYNFAINKSGQGVVFINIIHKGQNTGLDLKLDDVIKSLTGPLDKQVPDYKNFIQKVQVNLVRVLTDEPTSSETQTTTPPRNTESRTRNPLYVDPPQRDPGFQPSPLQIRPPSQPWLDPLADPRQVIIFPFNFSKSVTVFSQITILVTTIFLL